jgi:phosphopantetheinyl transferase
LEMMSQTASVLVDPDYSLTDIENVTFIRAGRFPHGKPQEFRTRVKLTEKTPDSTVLYGEVFCLSTHPGHPEPQETVHSSCRMRFGFRRPPQKPSLIVPQKGLTYRCIDASPLWETESFKNRRGVFRNIQSISSVTSESAVGEIQAPLVSEFGQSPCLDNPIRIDGLILLSRLSSALFRDFSLYYVANIESIRFYEPDHPAFIRLCSTKIVESMRDSLVCDIEAVGQDGLVRERLKGVRKVAAKRDSSKVKSDPILQSLRESLLHSDIGRILGFKKRLSFAHIDIPLVRNALDSDEKALLSEQLSAEEAEEYRSLRHAKRRLEWLVGRIVVKAAVRSCMTAEAPLASEITVKKDSSNSPFIHISGGEEKDVLLHVSLSHSFDVAVAAAAEGVRVGVDVEKISEKIQEIADRFAKAEEVDRFSKNRNIPKETSLSCIWTVKEASLKAVGSQVYTVGDFALEEVDVEGVYTVCRIRHPQSWHLKALTFADRGYAYALCLLPMEAGL